MKTLIALLVVATVSFISIPLAQGDYCGNNIVEPTEECDDGMQNSSTLADACRPGECKNAYCGDLVVDTGEDCDDGSQNSDIGVNACRTNCKEAHCGDGVTDGAKGEECDTGGETPYCTGCKMCFIPKKGVPLPLAEGDTTGSGVYLKMCYGQYESGIVLDAHPGIQSYTVDCDGATLVGSPMKLLRETSLGDRHLGAMRDIVSKGRDKSVPEVSVKVDYGLRKLPAEGDDEGTGMVTKGARGEMTKSFPEAALMRSGVGIKINTGGVVVRNCIITGFNKGILIDPSLSSVTLVDNEVCGNTTDVVALQPALQNSGTGNTCSTHSNWHDAQGGFMVPGCSNPCP